MHYEHLVARLARQWIAGDVLNDALNSTKEVNKLGMHAIINYLGEHINDEHIIKDIINEYILILEEIYKQRLDASISLKLTQIGLDIDEDKTIKNLETIATIGRKYNKFVWIDMESFKYLNKSIEIYIDLRKRYDNIGIAIQSYIKDILVYIQELLDNDAIIRLVKGAYKEEPNIVFRSRELIDNNYRSMMRLLFKESNNFAIATHDNSLIADAIKLSKVYKKKFEFQMLKGIRDDLKKTLVSNGYAVGEYIPYGSNILNYSIRRIKEHPTNIFLLVRSIL